MVEYASGRVFLPYTCGGAGIGRQARLRGVCLMACGFKSHPPHHMDNIYRFSIDIVHILYPQVIHPGVMTLDQLWEYAHTYIQGASHDAYAFLMVLENNQNDI